MVIPCRKCLLIPICRNKPQKELFNDCSLIESILKTFTDADEWLEFLDGITSTIKSKRWLADKNRSMIFFQEDECDLDIEKCKKIKTFYEYENMRVGPILYIRIDGEL